MNVEQYIITNVLRAGVEDTRPGTAIRDLLIKPHIILLDPLMREIERIRISQAMKNYNLMTTNEMDLLVSNILLQRKEGSYANGVVRFKFKDPVSVIIPEGTEVYYQDRTYLVSSTVSASEQEMSYNIDGSYYYVDVPIQSIEKKYTYNLDTPGLIMETNFIHPLLVKVENITAITGAIDEETNEELYYAAKRAIGERTLLRDDGAYTILTRQFHEIRRMEIVGCGDPEMTRDLLHGVHMGGMVDFYIDTAAKALVSKQFFNIPEAIEIRQLNDSNEQYVIGDVPVLLVTNIIEIDPLTGEPTGVELQEGPDYNVLVEDTEGNYSMFQRNKIVFSQPWIGRSVMIYYLANPILKQVQDFVSDVKNRVNNANHRVYNLIPSYIDIDLKYKGKGSPEEVIETIKSFIANNMLYELRWENSDLIDHLYNEGVCDYVELPFTCVVRDYQKNGQVTQTQIISAYEISRLNVYYPGVITAHELL